jgi:hypothetical protein
MTKDQISAYQSGYRDCRDVTTSRLREIIKQSAGQQAAVVSLIAELEGDAADELWQGIQEECPGITRAEYEAELDESAKAIRTKYYNSKGHLKLRLVRK